MREKVAVHWNFAERRLSVRGINASGKLGALLATLDEAVIEDAAFTSDEGRWRRWSSGEAKKVRQFAEIRGRLVRSVPEGLEWRAVELDPARSHEFKAGGRKVSRAAYVRIAGREIQAAGAR